MKTRSVARNYPISRIDHPPALSLDAEWPIAPNMFGKFLVERGLLTEKYLLDALEEQVNMKVSSGRVAFELGLIDMDQLFETLQVQRTTGLRFCAQAGELGYINDAQRLRILETQATSQVPLGQVLLTLGLVPPLALAAELERYEELYPGESHTV